MTTAQLPIRGIGAPLERGLRFQASRAAGTHIHQGWDLFAPQGTPVRAAADGVVVLVQRAPAMKPRRPAVVAGGYGAQVILRHSDGTFTRYTHMEPDAIPDHVRVGAAIARDSIIGAVGTTRWAWDDAIRDAQGRIIGRGPYRFIDRMVSSAAHVHWETMLHQRPARHRGRLDPDLWLRERGATFGTYAKAEQLRRAREANPELLPFAGAKVKRPTKASRPTSTRSGTQS